MDSLPQILQGSHQHGLADPGEHHDPAATALTVTQKHLLEKVLKIILVHNIMTLPVYHGFLQLSQTTATMLIIYTLETNTRSDLLVPMKTKKYH